MLDLNKNKGFIIALAGALVLLIVGIILWRSTVSSMQEKIDDIESAKSQYNSLVKKYKGVPNKKLVKMYNLKLDELNKISSEMLNVAPHKKLPTFDPSSIKVAIREAKDKFVDLSAEKNIRLPEDIGWAEYLGPNVPKSSDIPKLTRQFVTINDVLNILCSDNAKVEEISVIDRNPSGSSEEDDMEDEDVTFDDGPSPRTSKSKEKTEKEELYDAVPVQFEFRTKPSALYNILAQLRNKNYFYRIEKINDNIEIQSSGDVTDPSNISETLIVKLLVDNIQLKQNNN